MSFEYTCHSGRGRREQNEDCYGVVYENGAMLALVADGLGGHANGKVASKMAVEAICEELQGQSVDEEALLYSILHASQAISRAHISGHSTITALWVKDGYAVAAHVGDSRIYQFRKGEILYQSVDHSVVQMAVLVGELQPEAMRHHKDRNRLFRVLGEEEDPSIDSQELMLLPGDALLMCSDGFWEPVTEADMLTALAVAKSPQAWLDAMTEQILAINDPKQDNFTAVCIFVK